MRKDISGRMPFMLLVAVLAAGLLLSRAAASDRPALPQDSPAIAFDSTEFDFGSIYHGETASHTFTFRNRGTAPLEISSVGSTCGCAVTKLSSETVQPGETGTLEVAFDSAGLAGKLLKHVWVMSNDPMHGLVRLFVKGEVKVEARAVPAGVYFGRLPYRDTLEKSVLLTPLEGRLEVLGAEAADPALRVVGLKPAAPREPAGSYTLTIRIGPFAKPGPFTSRVIIHTALPHQKRIVIPVYGSTTDTRVPVPEGVRMVDLAEAKATTEGKSMPVLDARSPEEYAAGHIPGALSLPVAAFEEHFLSLADTIAAAPEVLVYCESEDCSEGVELTMRLKEAYQGSIYLFARGWRQWTEAGYAVTKGARP